MESGSACQRPSLSGANPKRRHRLPFVEQRHALLGDADDDAVFCVSATGEATERNDSERARD